MMRYGSGHRALELAAIGMHGGLSCALLTLWLASRPSWLDVGVALATTLPAVIVADFLSALVHFCADRFGSSETPLVGKNVIRSFREHHVDPKAMTQHDFVTIAGDSSFLTVPY